jgi:hypothetical protein
VPSLFEARRRLPTSATALRRAGNQTRALQSSQGRRPRSPSFSSTRHAASLAGAVTRGEPRDVRPCEPQCWFLSVARVCPTVMLARTPHLRRLAPTERSEDRRARVEGPSEGRVPWAHATISRACVGCVRFVAHADGVPLLGVLRTSAVIGALDARGGYPEQPADRPRPSFRRRPAKGAAFQKTRMPFTATTREGIIMREGIAPSGLRAGSPAHAAHTVAPGGVSVLDGHCEVTVRSPADP